jgi:hypothetical protein
MTADPYGIHIHLVFQKPEGNDRRRLLIQTRVIESGILGIN